jgi:hypothetical protein
MKKSYDKESNAFENSKKNRHRRLHAELYIIHNLHKGRSRTVTPPEARLEVRQKTIRFQICNKLIIKNSFNPFGKKQVKYLPSENQTEHKANYNQIEGLEEEVIV